MDIPLVYSEEKERKKKRNRGGRWVEEEKQWHVDKTEESCAEEGESAANSGRKGEMGKEEERN